MSGENVTCPVGWTNKSDFSYYTSSTQNASECLISFLGVKVLSFLSVIIAGICSILIIRDYMKLVIKKRTFNVLFQNYKSSFPCCFLSMDIAIFIYGILKLSYSDDKIPYVGKDLSISLIIILPPFTCFLGISIYLQVLFVFLKSCMRIMSIVSRIRFVKRFHFLSIFSVILPPISLIFSIMPVISLKYPIHSTPLNMTYLIGNGIVALLYGLIFINSLNFVLKELNTVIYSSSNSNDYNDNNYKESNNGNINDIDNNNGNNRGTSKDSNNDYNNNLVNNNNLTNNINNTNNNNSKNNGKDIKQIVFRLEVALILVGSAAILAGIFYLVFGVPLFLFHLTSYWILILQCMCPPLVISLGEM